MTDSPNVKCPLCGADNWHTILDGPDCRVDMCASGCIARTMPPPVFEESPVTPPGTKVEGAILADDPRSGHFRLAKELLDAVGKHQPSGRLLDIGCGWGHLLRLAQDGGYDVLGLEASPAAAQFARDAFGVQPEIGFFPQKTYEPNSFDVVTLNHVLEHVDEPVVVLREAGRILKPGGVLGVECPNFDSVMRRMVSQHWVGLQPSQHVWQLSVRSIQQMMRKAGLEPVTTRTTSQEYVRAGRSLPKWLRLRLLLWSACLIGQGDNAIVVARKPV